jgi:hypothetical protein
MNDTVIYIDISGSVNNSIIYWNKVNEIVSLNKNAIFIVWDTKIKEVTYNEMLKYIKTKTGYSGTDISRVALSIVYNKYCDNNIIIITDGEVSSSYVKLAESILTDFNIKEVECYIIKDNSYSSEIDISVPLPFMRNNTSKLYYTNSENITTLIKNINKTDYEILKNITLENVMNNYNLVYDIINISNMGKSGLPVIKEKLLKIRTEFIKLSNESLKVINGNTVQNELQTGNYENAIDLIKQIEDIFTNQIDNSPISKFDKLLALCDNRTNNGFAINQKILNATKCSDIIPEEPTENELNKYEFEDPVMLDLDVPQLVILKSNEQLFSNDKEFKNFIENPLTIIGNEELKNKIAKRLGHCIGIKLTNKCILDPYTRIEILGTIPLTTSNLQHNQVGSHNLFKLFTNSKKLGNPNLYYVILWQILVVENKCEYLNEYKDHITNHLKFRLSNAMTYISLCGLPDFNRTIVPMDVAMYYIINGPKFNKTILRKHIFNIDVILNIIMNVFKYQVSKEIIKHINLEKTLLSMLSLVKKDSKGFKRKFKCLINSYIIADNEYIPVDKIATKTDIDEIMKTFPDYYKTNNVNELIYLSSIVNRNLSANAIILEYNKPIKYDVNFNNEWSDKYIVSKPEPLKISLKTFRIEYNSNWKELSEKENGVSIDKQLSAYNVYIKYYIKYKHFPSFNEFAKYIYNKYNKVLPKDFNTIYIEIDMAYTDVRNYIEDKKLSYEDVKKIILDSCKIEDRIRIQT